MRRLLAVGAAVVALALAPSPTDAANSPRVSSYRLNFGNDGIPRSGTVRFVGGTWFGTTRARAVVNCVTPGGFNRYVRGPIIDVNTWDADDVFPSTASCDWAGRRERATMVTYELVW